MDEIKTGTDSAPDVPLEDEISQLGSNLLEYVIMALVSVVISIACLAGYHFWFAEKNRTNLSSIDVAEVMQIKELQLTISMSAPGVSDVERGAAFETIATFAKDIDIAITELQEQCNCVLLVRAAVVKGVPDLTPILKEKLGMGDIQIDQLINKLKTLGGDPPKVREMQEAGVK